MPRSTSLQSLAALLGLALFSLAPATTARTPEPRPDLIVGTLALSHDKAAPDSTVRVDFTVENRGEAAAEGISNRHLAAAVVVRNAGA